MSPKASRQEDRQAPAPRSKPYARKRSKVSVKTSMDTSPLIDVLLGPATDLASRRGFPTYDQYKQAESTYLNALSRRKRDKALITQEIFDRIWDLLHDPDARIGTSQFRFWVRKMFVLSDPMPTQLAGHGAPGVSAPVVLHAGRPVAIVEQLYDLLCYCHGLANHAGRDRTAALVRQHYSWVPKELVAKFVKACPTCALGRNGRSELIAMVQERTQHEYPAGEVEMKDEPVSGVQMNTMGSDTPAHAIKIESPIEPFPSSRSSLSISDLIHAENWTQDDVETKESWAPSNGPLDMPKFMPEHSRNSSESSTGTTSSSGPMINPGMQHPVRTPEPPSSSKPKALQSHAMSREVSMLNGAPNGWKYFLDNPEAYQAQLKAHPELLTDTATDEQAKAAKRPRIPSVALKKRVGSMDEKTRAKLTQGVVNLPPLMKALSEGLVGRNDFMRDRPEFIDSLPLSLQPLRVFKGEMPASQRNLEPYVPQIDPTLLEAATTPTVTAVNHGETADAIDEDIMLGHATSHWANPRGLETDVSMSSIQVTAPTPPKSKGLRRAAAPPRIDLGASSNALNRLINFTSYREEDMSPMSTGGVSTRAEPSSTPSSASSCYSQLSSFPVTATSSLGESSTSPGVSNLPPSKEVEMIATELAVTTSNLKLDNKEQRGSGVRGVDDDTTQELDTAMSFSPGPEAWNDI